MGNQSVTPAFNLTLSSAVADYTLDCWPNDIGVEPPTIISVAKGCNTWTVAITDRRQLKEFFDQAAQQVDMYAIQGCYDSSERAECAKWKRAYAKLAKIMQEAREVSA